MYKKFNFKKRKNFLNIYNEYSINYLYNLNTIENYIHILYVRLIAQINYSHTCSV